MGKIGVMFFYGALFSGIFAICVRVVEASTSTSVTLDIPIRFSNFFSEIQIPITWLLGLLIAGFLVYITRKNF